MSIDSLCRMLHSPNPPSCRFCRDLFQWVVVLFAVQGKWFVDVCRDAWEIAIDDCHREFGDVYEIFALSHRFSAVSLVHLWKMELMLSILLKWWYFPRHVLLARVLPGV